MKDIGKELCKLGDAIATSLGCIILTAAIFFTIAVVMRSIYCRPPEECDETSSHNQSHGHGNTAQLIANPVHKWHPLNIYHRR